MWWVSAQTHRKDRRVVDNMIWYPKWPENICLVIVFCVWDQINIHGFVSSHQMSPPSVQIFLIVSDTCIFLCTELTVGRPCAWTRPVATLSECYSLTRHDGQTDGRTSRFVIMSATTRRDDCLDMIRLFADRQNNGLIAALITTLQTTVPADGIDRRQTDSQPPIAARCYA